MQFGGMQFGRDETAEKHERNEDQLRMRVEVLTRELETRARVRT